MKKTSELRTLLNGKELIVAPGGFTPLSSIIAEKVGFKCMYMGGYAVAAFRCGYPDVGLMTMDESLSIAREMARAARIPLIADVDNAYGNAINVRRTVVDYEQAGIAGIQMEDQMWPKKCGHMEGKMLVPAEEMCKKIEAAIASRTDPDFVIIARTDANTVLGFEEAVRRSNLFAEAGADMIFFESPTSVEQLERIPSLVKAPVMINMAEGAKTPLLTNRELQKLGYKLVIYPISSILAATQAIIDIYGVLKKEGTTAGAQDKMFLFHEFNEIIGVPEAYEWAKKYSYEQ